MANNDLQNTTHKTQERTTRTPNTNDIKCSICWHHEWTQMVKLKIMSASSWNIFSHSWLINRFVTRVARQNRSCFPLSFGSTRLIYCVIYGAYGIIHSATNSSPDLTQSVESGSCMQYLVTLIMLEIKHLFITPYISIVEIICEIKCIISDNMSENSSYIYGTMSETKW
jgi:hypothetical protein